MPDTLSKHYNSLDNEDIIINQYPDIPDYIIKNLKTNLILRPYQEKALRRFFYHINKKKNIPRPIHLLYHMATGSGKTVLMACLILELYQKGYRNFIFFVNSDNIIQKTKENFLNHTASKYLFAETLKFSDKDIVITETCNFDSVNEDHINIHFTTIQGLHRRIHEPHENAITIDDFENKKIVLISDEAHHINADTKKSKTQKESELSKSWESTIHTIFNQNFENILLEFTATIDLENGYVAEKYHDKIIFDYDLKHFRNDGYSKEVDVVEVDNFDALERAFQAVILSQYRRKIAQKYGLNIKPVILLKSKQIKESQDFREVFHNFISQLTVEDLEKLRHRLNVVPFAPAFTYFEDNDISFENLILELQVDFDRTKSLDINDTKELLNNQILVNSLEDANNEIRVIFAVDKLNEGWDVLNLFDIVRLYDTRDGGKTTMQEAQLIGRGARYCPFDYGDTIKDKRKFDDDINNDLRILEELHYHSPKIPKYIFEIKEALRKAGILNDNRIEQTLIVKEEFKKTEFWNNGYIYLNKQQKIDRKAFQTFDDYNLKKDFPINLGTGEIATENLLTGTKTTGQKKETTTKYINLTDFGKAILRRAIDTIPFYRFPKLQHFFPSLDSVKYFIKLEDFLKKVTVTITTTHEHFDNLTQKGKLDIVIDVLKQLEQDIQSKNVDYIGTKDFKPYLLKEYIKDKTLRFAEKSDNSDADFGLSITASSKDFRHIDLMKCDWYVFNDCFGTSEEKYFLRYIHSKQDAIKKLYEEFYIIRNEKFFKIYDFKDGRAFEPDFVMMLKKRHSEEKLIYQIFVEPKGKHLLENDKWKEDFLKDITDKNILFNTQHYHIYGLPFYNENRKREFDKACHNIIGI